MLEMTNKKTILQTKTTFSDKFIILIIEKHIYFNLISMNI